MAKKQLLTYKGAVSIGECDSNNHMNVMYYINKYELAGRNLFAILGISKQFLRENNLGIAVLEQNIKYQKEVFEDDVLYIESTIEGFNNKVITFQHVLKEGITHKVSGSVLMKVVLFDSIKRKAIPIPQLIQKKLQEFL